MPLTPRDPLGGEHRGVFRGTWPGWVCVFCFFFFFFSAGYHGLKLQWLPSNSRADARRPPRRARPPLPAPLAPEEPEGASPGGAQVAPVPVRGAPQRAGSVTKAFGTKEPF